MLEELIGIIGIVLFCSSVYILFMTLFSISAKIEDDENSMNDLETNNETQYLDIMEREENNE